jgi:hypothetical protein
MLEATELIEPHNQHICHVSDMIGTEIPNGGKRFSNCKVVTMVWFQPGQKPTVQALVRITSTAGQVFAWVLN